MKGDGMVSMGSMIVKPNAVKIRRIFPKGVEDEQKATLVGFAGATADAFTLLERLEGKLDEYPGQLPRACVELAKGWRTDKYLRRLEAALIVADETVSLEITGNGDVLEMTDGVISVGSGSPYALGTYHFLWKGKNVVVIQRRVLCGDTEFLFLNCNSFNSGGSSAHECRGHDGRRSSGQSHERCFRYVRTHE
jgi:ATP-dependent protease HslVU peptidase subunit